MKLVSPLDPILTTPTQKFDFLAPPFEPIEFSKEFIKVLYELKGIGLAGNQVGIPYSVFAMRGDPENFVCFNPRIVDTSEEKITLEEGCLTFKDLYLEIERPRHIKVRFQTPNGDTITKSFTGITARTFQHELDHLNGILYTSYVSKLKLTMKLNKIKKKNRK